MKSIVVREQSPPNCFFFATIAEIIDFNPFPFSLIVLASIPYGAGEFFGIVLLGAVLLYILWTLLFLALFLFRML